MNARPAHRARRARAAVRTAATRIGRRTGWGITITPYAITLEPRPRRSCPTCHGDGGWWNNGDFPEMETCPCWAHRPAPTIRLHHRPHDEPPF